VLGLSDDIAPRQDVTLRITRKDGSVVEHALAPDPLLDFTGPDYQGELRKLLELVLSGAASPA